MSDKPKRLTMSVREFLRGGYHEVNAPVVVLNGGEVKGTWYPGLTGVSIDFTEEQAAPPAPTNGKAEPAPKPRRAARARSFPDLTRRA